MRGMIVVEVVVALAAVAGLLAALWEVAPL